MDAAITDSLWIFPLLDCPRIYSPSAWRKAFPEAKHAVIARDRTHVIDTGDENSVWSDSTFHLLKGIDTLYFVNSQRGYDGDDIRSFEHLYGTIHTLVISPRIQITTESFFHLRGIHTLIIPDNRHITAD